MVKSLWQLFAEHLPATLEIAYHLLLLRVYAKHRKPLVKASLSKGGNLLELCVSVLDLFQCLGLDEGAFFETTRSCHLADVIVRNVYTALFENLSNLSRSQADPPDGIVLWESGRMSLYDVVEHFEQYRFLVQ